MFVAEVRRKNQGRLTVYADEGYTPDYDSDGQVIQRAENATGTIDWIAEQRANPKKELIEKVKEMMAIVRDRNGLKFAYSPEGMIELLRKLYPGAVITITEQRDTK